MTFLSVYTGTAGVVEDFTLATVEGAKKPSGGWSKGDQETGAKQDRSRLLCTAHCSPGHGAWWSRQLVLENALEP